MKTQNEELYDHVTDAWQDIMGNNFHFGYFENPDVPLTQATNALIDKMASLAEITEDTRILDVGCGIGGPAMYLFEKYKCSICGITTSEKGIETARKRSQSHDRLKFKVADGTNNGEADGSYDIVWVMESSHLMNQSALLQECYRVLKPKGTLLLCDLMYVYNEPISNVIKILKSFVKYSQAKFVYGVVKPWPLERYWSAIHKLGFNDITTINISKNVFPTMANWKQNVITNEAEILRANKYTKEEISNFIQSCERLELIFDQSIIGYAIVKAIKP